MDLELFQSELADIIGVDEGTIHNWECSHVRPSMMFILKIIEFLGYNPLEDDLNSSYPIYMETFGDHIRKKRIDQGITQRNLAKSMGVSIDAIRDWEKGRTKPLPGYKIKIGHFLGYDPDDCHR